MPSFVHEADLTMAPGSEPAAIGAAITMLLCGSLDHEPPCPIASHHTGFVERDGVVSIRVLFATPADKEAEVRRLIETALTNGDFSHSDHPDARWSVEKTGPGTILETERPHAARLERRSEQFENLL